MRKAFAYKGLCVLILLFAVGQKAFSQYKVKGTVFDSSRIYTLQSVSVMTTSGRGTITDSLGRYQIEMSEKDSIWFSYLGKPTPKYPFTTIPDIFHFDIALNLKATVMKEIKLRTRSYKEDSLQNRKDYAKAFNYQKPSLKTATIVTGLGVGVDIQELIRMFQFRKNKSMLKFQKRVIEQEQQKYIDHRFNKLLVSKLTGLEGEALSTFMQLYRPSYEFAVFSSEYDFLYYIKKAGEEFKNKSTGF